MPPLFMLLTLVFWIVVLGGGFALASRFIRAFERRGSDRGELAELRDRLARLEESFTSVSGQVEQIAEAQQFTTQLLSERDESGLRD